MSEYDDVIQEMKRKIALIFDRVPALMLFSFSSYDTFNDEYIETNYPWQNGFSFNNVVCWLEHEGTWEGDKDTLLGISFVDDDANDIPATIELMEIAGILHSFLQSFNAAEYHAVFGENFKVLVTRTNMIVDYFPDEGIE